MIRISSTSAFVALAFAALAGSASAETIFIEKQQTNEFMAHRLVGTPVLNAMAEQIGEVKDVVINGQGTAVAVVIGVGGYLGVAEKLVAVPFAQIQIGDVVQSSRVVVLDTSKDALAAAPAYVGSDPAMVDRAKQKASDWMAVAKAKAIEYAKIAADKAKALTAPKDTAVPAPTKP